MTLSALLTTLWVPVQGVDAHKGAVMRRITGFLVASLHKLLKKKRFSCQWFDWEAITFIWRPLWHKKQWTSRYKAELDWRKWSEVKCTIWFSCALFFIRVSSTDHKHSCDWFTYFLRCDLTHLSPDKRPPFRRRYFQLHVRKWKVLYFDKSFADVCSYGTITQHRFSYLDNCLVPNRRQAIIWSNADRIHWRISATLGGD